MTARSESFRFHAAHWLADIDTRTMGCFARGVYIDLLALQWREGFVPDDPEKVARVCGVTAQESDFFDAAWPDVRACFTAKDGRLVNKRLEAERKSLDRYLERQRRLGRKGGKARWKGARRPAGETTRAERETAAPGTHTPEEWEELRAAVGDHCPRCGEWCPEMVKDHVVPLAMGGGNSVDNLQPLCRECNSEKGPEAVDYIKDVRARLDTRA